MEKIFIKLLNMSITASWIILIIILFRFVMKKAPKNIRCILWAIAAVRLICPVSLESALSLVPSTEIIYSDTTNSSELLISNNISTFDNTTKPIIDKNFTPEEKSKENNPMNFLLHAITMIWILGMLVLNLYAAISYLNLHKKISEGIILNDNIWMCDHILSPFIWGIIKPRIFLPSSIKKQHIEFIIAHEKAHLSRHDNLWKPLGFLLLTVYWFNPLIWMAYILFCRDIELACDEKVIKEFDIYDKKAYSTVLLACSTNQNIVTINPVAFGEIGIKERIKAVMKYKKPKLWIGYTAAIICVAVIVCFLTNPITTKSKNTNIDNILNDNYINDKSLQEKSSFKASVNNEDNSSKTNIPKSGQIYGYITKINAKSITIDRQYWVTSESDDWKPEYNEDAGFAVVDADEENITYKLNKNCTYSILKNHQYSRTELNFRKFRKYYKKMEYQILWVITLKNNKVMDISEQYLP